MDKCICALDFEIKDKDSVRMGVNRLILAQRRGFQEREERLFRIKLVFNELITQVLSCCSDGTVRVGVRCCEDCIKIDIHNACMFAEQLIRVYSTAPDESPYEVEVVRVKLLRELTDDLVFSAKRDRFTAKIRIA